MTTINVYLIFNGNCEEAFEFYRSVFGGEFGYKGRFRDIPPEAGIAPLPNNIKDRILHISLPIGGDTYLFGSDAGEEWGPEDMQGNNFCISITTDSREKADHFYRELSAGGKVIEPIGMAFWGDYYARFTDKFGINWMVSFAEEQQPK
jgi:PhnB protein